MPLTKQNAVVPFVGGIQTKQNEFLVQPPNLLELDNGVFKLEGEIAKRHGFEALSALDFNGNSVVGKKLLTYNNDLVQLSQTNLYSYVENGDKWFNKGAFASVTASKTSVIRNRASQTNQCNATNNGISVVAWSDSRASNLLKYSIIDESTQTVIVADTALSSSGTWVAASKFLTSFVVLLYKEGLALKSKIIDTVSFAEYNQTISGVAVGTGTVASVLQVGTSLVVLHNNGSNFAEITSLYLDNVSAPTLIKNGAVGGQLLPAGTMTCCHLFQKESSNQVFAIYSTGTAVRLQAAFNSLILNSAHNVLVATAAATVPRVSGIASTMSSDIILTWETSAADTKNHYISTRHYSYNSATAPSAMNTDTIIKRAVGLAAHCFSFNNAIYFVSAHESSLQPTIFLLEYVAQTNVVIAGKFLTSISGGHPVSGLMPSVEEDAVGKKVISLLEITKLNTETGTITDNTGVVKLKLDFQNPPFVGAQLGQSLLIAGGFIAAYDGASVVEHSFHLYPEDITVTSPPGVGYTEAGVYNVRVIYEWSDAKGQIYRSAPSITVQHTAAALDSLVVTVPTLRLSSKQDVSIVVHITAANKTLFYRAGTLANDPTVDTVNITVANTPTSITGLANNEILYTAGGVVENIAPPTASIVQRHKNRIFIAGLENDNELRYSQESTINEGLGFSDFYSIRVNPAGGPITALGTLDDKLIIFKQDSIYTLAGNGPVLTGQGNDYGQPEEVSSDVGCSNPSSIVVTPAGLMFASDKGIRLLDRSLQVEDIGAPVEKYETYTVTSATLIPDSDEVRFTTSSGPNLVYNYAFNLWSVFTNYSSNSAVAWSGRYLHLSTTGTVHQEVSGSYNDNGKAIPLHLKTSWIALAGLQGYKRVYRILFLGKKLSEHAFRVNIRYDYEDIIRETVYFNTMEEMNQETVPQDTLWIGVGSTAISGNKSEVFQFEVLPRIQKCESIQLEIEDVPLNGNISSSYTLSGLTFLIGVIDGTPNLTSSIGSKK